MVKTLILLPFLGLTYCSINDIIHISYGAGEGHDASNYITPYIHHIMITTYSDYHTKRKITTGRLIYLLTTLGVVLLVFLFSVGYRAVTAYTQSLHEQIEGIKTQHQDEIDTLMEQQKAAVEAAEEAKWVATKEAQVVKAAMERAQREVKAAAITPISTDTSVGSSTDLTAAEIERLSRSIVEIKCSRMAGSGFLFRIPNKSGGVRNAVFTNNHTIEKDMRAGTPSCYVDNDFFPTAAPTGVIDIRPDKDKMTVFNHYADFVAADLHLLHGDDRKKLDERYRAGERYLSQLDFFSLDTMPLCPADHPTGSVVYAMGYPTYSRGNIVVVKNSIIGKDNMIKNLPHDDYLTSASIDSGMSGGAAFSKTKNGEICLLGINTWVLKGTYENVGVIQNIHNIMYSK